MPVAVRDRNADRNANRNADRNAVAEPVADRYDLSEPIGDTVMTARCRALLSRDPSPDAGFTLIELLVAVGVFGILMLIVGAAMMSAFAGVNNVVGRTNSQATARNAGEWTGKLLRYTDLPEGQTEAITEAGPSSITFFTYSGTGMKHDVPYRARIYSVINADQTRSILSQVWMPRAVSGGWTWATAPVTRTLLTVPRNVVPLRVAVWVRNPVAVPTGVARDATPGTSGPLVLATGEVPESVVLQIGDSTDTRNLVTQQIRLGNLS